jgi:membrane-associated phospholipid phosphatase
MYIWDLLSLIVYALVAYPFIRLIDTYSPSYLHLIVGILCCLIFIKLTRFLPAFHPIMLRPKGACNCNIANSGGCYENRIGMPSGHVLLAAFVVSWLVVHNPTPITFAMAAFVIIIVALARYKKKCHNILQVIVGAILGITFALIGARLSKFILS